MFFFRGETPRAICVQRGRRPEVILVVIGQCTQTGRDQSVILKSNWLLYDQSYATPALPLREIMVYYKRSTEVECARVHQL